MINGCHGKQEIPLGQKLHVLKKKHLQKIWGSTQLSSKCKIHCCWFFFFEAENEDRNYGKWILQHARKLIYTMLKTLNLGTQPVKNAD